MTAGLPGRPGRPITSQELEDWSGEGHVERGWVMHWRRAGRFPHWRTVRAAWRGRSWVGFWRGLRGYRPETWPERQARLSALDLMLTNMAHGYLREAGPEIAARVYPPAGLTEYPPLVLDRLRRSSRRAKRQARPRKHGRTG